MERLLLNAKMLINIKNCPHSDTHCQNKSFDKLNSLYRYIYCHIDRPIFWAVVVLWLIQVSFEFNRTAKYF